MKGLAEEGRRRTSAFAGEQKACKKGEESTSNEKTSLPVSSSKQLLSSYTGRELQGEKRELPRDEPKLAKTSLGLWRGTAVKLKGPHGYQRTRTTGSQPGVKLCISTKPAQEHIRGMSEQILVLFQQRDRRHIRRKYIPLNILK